MANILDIYARSSRRLALTPAERALLRTFDQLLISAIAGALLAILQAALSGGAALSLASIAQIGEYAFAVALLTGAAKLFRARGDTLGRAAAPVLDQAAARVPTPSGPLVKRLTTASGAFPPLMPDTGPQRAALMRAAGATLASDSQPMAVTRPAAAVTAVSQTYTGATAAQETQTASEPSLTTQAAPAPSQSEIDTSASAPTDEATGDGPPTLQVAAMRAAKSVTVLEPPTGTATVAPQSQWLTN